MKYLTSILICGALLVLSALALSAANPWSVRVRATYLQTADQSDAFTALSINFPKDAISVNDKLIPEIDIDYAFTDTIYGEVVLTIPQTQEVTLAGVGKLGTFKHLPPCFLFGYRFNPTGTFRPYVGAGFNYTLIWGNSLSVAGVPLHLDHHSIGFAAQAGVDWNLGNSWSVNVDLKHASLSSDVYAGSTRLTTAQLDPWLYAVGLRYDF